MMEGPTIENLVEEVQQVVLQGSTDIVVLRMEFSDLHNKIEVPFE